MLKFKLFVVIYEHVQKNDQFFHCANTKEYKKRIIENSYDDECFETSNKLEAA